MLRERYKLVGRNGINEGRVENLYEGIYNGVRWCVVLMSEVDYWLIIRNKENIGDKLFIFVKNFIRYGIVNLYL